MEKIRYEKQITDYHCVPAVVRMLLGQYGIDFISQEDLGYTFDTREEHDGTYYSDMKYSLNLLGFRRKRISKAKALELVKEGKPVALSYQTGKDAYHAALLVKRDRYESVLMDPYFGRNLKMPTGSLDILTRNYWILEEL